MEDIIPPTPPEAKIQGNQEELPEFDLGDKKRKSFFSKILGKKEEVSEKVHIREETSSKVPEVSDEDLENIRKALGISDDNQPSIRAEFEEKVEKEANSDEENFDKITEIAEEQDDDIKPPVFVKKKQAKKQIIKTTKETKPKKQKEHSWIKPPELTELILKHNKDAPIKKPEIVVNPEKPLIKLDKEFEKNKEQLVKKVENKQATVSHAKNQAKKHFDNYKKNIDKLARSHKIQLNKEIKIHELKLKKKAVQLENKRKTLNSKELKLKEWEIKLSNKEKSLNKQINELEEYSKEITLLDIQLNKNKEDIEKQKAILSDLKSQLLSTKKSIEETNLEQKQMEKDHDASLKKIDDELKKKRKEYEELEKKSYSEKKILESKKAELKKEREKLEKLVEDEKKVSEALKSRDSIDKDKRISVIEDKEVNHDEWQDDYHKKFVAVQESPQDEIHEKIDDCRELLSEQKFDDAKFLYNDIRNEFMNSDVPDDMKVSLKKEVKELYDEICLKILNKT